MYRDALHESKKVHTMSLGVNDAPYIGVRYAGKAIHNLLTLVHCYLRTDTEASRLRLTVKCHR